MGFEPLSWSSCPVGIPKEAIYIYQERGLAQSCSPRCTGVWAANMKVEAHISPMARPGCMPPDREALEAWQWKGRSGPVRGLFSWLCEVQEG